MLILAHRGLWRQPAEKNGLVALRSALAEGFGVETDIRDHAGELVISHDPPSANALPLADLLNACQQMASQGTLALNIKADGLQQPLADALARHRITPDRYFVFDMSVPDALGYLRLGMPCFTRQSEIEPKPAFLDQASGIWLDCFREDWINEGVILDHCAAGRAVALVSPELHGRDMRPAWEVWRNAYRNVRRQGQSHRIMICTDRPREAREYFLDAADRSDSF